MKTIIVPTDFSAAANNAVNYAADLAASIHADLHLLHCIELTGSFVAVPNTFNINEMQQTAETALQKLAAALLQERNNSINITTEVRTGLFFQELQDDCAQLHPYAVVMGSQGTTAAQRTLFGSHTIYAMKHLQQPMITVPPGVTFHSIKKIALACDFENVLTTVPTEEIKMIVNDFNASLHIIYTGKKPETDTQVAFGSEMLRSKLKPLDPVFHFISSDNTDTTIIDYADAMETDLLITIPKKHSFPEVLMHRSHTRKMVLFSAVPVMAVHGA
ncbi:MAG: universal stress protein [Bacteroidetes bacterium]|nr:universal stress protein [Bacteroidota bacterium]